MGDKDEAGPVDLATSKAIRSEIQHEVSKARTELTAEIDRKLAKVKSDADAHLKSTRSAFTWFSTVIGAVFIGAITTWVVSQLDNRVQLAMGPAIGTAEETLGIRLGARLDRMSDWLGSEFEALRRQTDADVAAELERVERVSIQLALIAAATPDLERGGYAYERTADLLLSAIATSAPEIERLDDPLVQQLTFRRLEQVMDAFIREFDYGRLHALLEPFSAEFLAEMARYEGIQYSLAYGLATELMIAGRLPDFREPTMALILSVDPGRTSAAPYVAMLGFYSNASGMDWDPEQMSVSVEQARLSDSHRVTFARHLLAVYCLSLSEEAASRVGPRPELIAARAQGVAEALAYPMGPTACEPR